MVWGQEHAAVPRGPMLEDDVKASKAGQPAERLALEAGLVTGAMGLVRAGVVKGSTVGGCGRQHEGARTGFARRSEGHNPPAVPIRHAIGVWG